MVLASVRFRVPESNWIGVFSRRHPELRLEYLSFAELDAHRSVADLWIGGGPPGGWAAELRRFDQVDRVDALAEVGGGCLYRLIFRNPPIVYLYRRLGVPLPLPIWVQAGSVRWEVVARAPEYARILEFGRSIDPKFRVVAVRRGPLPGHLPTLTPGQRRVLSAALAAGYFESPRRVTLGELARSLKRSRSALSETIAIIEERLLDSALGGRIFGPSPTG